ncbi:MAG: Predicted hydrolase [uncultured Sulfurovum sp.]|uniref:Predicted hydrolase n=1 Tax=uncultured Sulfurovum sp. TaxID=269237 RepID=A0A6S6SYX0_9BACT|nr:MAG: Predicted hydrolase [uncultured Sulfurovum sp.]
MKNINFSLFFKINLFQSIVFFVIFLFFNERYTALSFVITLLGAISSATILYILLYVLLFVFTFSKRLVLYLSMLLFILINISLIVDLFIYKLFNFHINAMVLNILTSSDAMDSVQTGLAPIIAFLVFIVGLIGFEFFLIKKIDAMNDVSKRLLNSKLNRSITIPLILIVLSEKVSYGLASLFSKNEIVSKFKVIPLYQPLTFRRIAAKHFGFKAEEQAKYSIKTEADLNYPLEALEIKDKVEKFNIIIVASDSVKYSIMGKETTPNVKKFEEESLVFKHHFSGGNSTRFGIFSLIYGLNPTYWFSFLNANQKPVLFDVLKKLDYKIDIISSTNTNWPEFRKTCYVDVQSSIQDKFDGKPWKKDEQNMDFFLQELDTHSKEKPLFSFVFLDAPHGYSYPKTHNKYNAPEGEVNYLSITKDSEELKITEKRYKNAVYYNDMLFGKMVSKLKEKGLYDNSLIIYTSDHGQEFFEQGNFGHNTSFSKGQVHIPFVLKLPKSLEGLGLAEKINSSMTSHQDVVPSLLSLLGVTTNASKYSNGKNFFSEAYERDYIFSSNWNNNAIVTKDFTYVFSNLPNKMFSNEVRDTESYKRLENQKSNSKLILDTMNENRKFLK